MTDGALEIAVYMGFHGAWGNLQMGISLLKILLVISRVFRVMFLWVIRALQGNSLAIVNEAREDARIQRVVLHSQGCRMWRTTPVLYGREDVAILQGS